MSGKRASRAESNDAERPLKKTKHSNSRNALEESQAEDGVEFELLQGYRKFENDILQGRAQVARSGDINITIKNLETVDELFSKANGSKNNSLFAQDSRAIASISELAQMSVRNLKFESSTTLVNIDDIMNGCKRFMLKEYMNKHNIEEIMMSTENDLEDTEQNQSTQKMRENMNRSKFLSNFEKYDKFNQINWFRLGSLYNSVSKNVFVADHVLGPFALEIKPREVAVRRSKDKLGELITAEKVTNESLIGDNVTTPQQVKKCFKTLIKKIGNSQINLFKFIINPDSFAKSIENLFYTSFLIKEGRLILEEDEDGLPAIRAKEKISSSRTTREIETQQRKDTQQKHIIFQLDYSTWENLKDKLDIKESFL